MSNTAFNIIHIAFKHGKDDNRIFRKECTSLAKRKEYNVIYITSDINSPLVSDECNNVQRIVIHAHPKRVYRSFVYLRQIKQVLMDIGKVSLVHLHETTLLPLVPYFIRKGISVVYDSHEDHEKEIRKVHGKALARTYKLYEKYVCRKIDAVIFPCKMLSDDPFYYGVKRLVYIDNYPIVSGLHDHQGRTDSFVACYTGTISIDRGVKNSVIAWDRAGIQGLLAGHFSSKSEQNEIEGLKEYKSTKYLGVIPSEKMGEIYEKVSLGMAVLLDKGQYHKSCNLPTKVGEYMMYGIPTVIYRTPYIEEVMGQYEFGIMVDPDSITEIVDAILRIKNNPEVALKMGEAGKKAVTEQFNWTKEEQKLFDLYDEILRG